MGTIRKRRSDKKYEKQEKPGRPLSKSGYKETINNKPNLSKPGKHSLKLKETTPDILKEFDMNGFNGDTLKKLDRKKLDELIQEVKEKHSSIKSAEKKEYYPLTEPQKRLYFINQLEGDNTAYNRQLMDVYCKGIEREALEETIIKLIKRYESLRTSFHTIEGEAVQKIHDYDAVCSNFEIEYYETSEDGMIYSEAPGKEWTEVTGIPFHDIFELFVRPFDLTRPPLLRVGLIKIYENTDVLMLDLHLIIADVFSLVLFKKALWALYDEEELPPLKVQYKDFSEWVNSKENIERLKKQEEYWQSQYNDNGEIAVLNLPYDYPGNRRMTFDGKMLHFEIGKSETQNLNKITQEQDTTLYMVLFAAFNVLLAKLSGQEEIIVGTLAIGRTQIDIQPDFGMFAHTLALRNFPIGEKAFKTFLAEVKKKILDAFENQDYPFEQLIRKLAIMVDTGRNPLFDVVFGLRNEAERDVESFLETLMLDKSNPYKTRKTKFDITLIGEEMEDELHFNIEYNTNLFDEETIERFIQCFKKIIFSVSDDISQKISDIEILPELEKGMILYAFNDTESEYPNYKTVHELFEEQVSQGPDNIAVVGGATNTGHRTPRTAHSLDERPLPRGLHHALNYRQLNVKANQLARLLQAKGIRPGDLAAIMVEPSLEMIIGMMGVLKTGGVFLPIDHNISEERINYMLQESGARLFLTHKGIIEEMKMAYKGEIINMDNDFLYSGDERDLAQVNTSRDVACVIYTSDYTLKPKGVMVEHRSLVNLCSWHNKYYSVTSNDRATKYTGFGYDATVWEVFPYLVKGASIYVVPEEIKLDIKALNCYYEENGITISFLPIQIYEQFITLNNSSLRVLLTKGNKLKSFVERDYRLFNNYGPTENTVVATSYQVTELTGDIPIGKPIHNNQIYILDKNGHLQPIGVPGELCIGGDSAARGYLNNPELTKDKFITNPYPLPIPLMQAPMLYRTGDLARWLPVGILNFWDASTTR